MSLSRAEARIAIRDHLLANFMEAIVGEGAGKIYQEAVREADRQLDEALKGRGGGT